MITFCIPLNIAGFIDPNRKGAVADILDFKSCCEVIRTIEQYYDFGTDYANITPELIISNYLDVYLGRLTADDLRDIFSI
jgi:hypothetical protein